MNEFRHRTAGSGSRIYLWMFLVCAFFSRPTNAADPDSVALAGPEVSKLDWNTRSLVAHDFDADGRNDLGLINNDLAKIELLYQTEPGDDSPKRGRNVRANRWEPVLEDARFRRESIVTGAYLYALASGDLDGDSRPDLVFTSNREPLKVLYQDPVSEWEREWIYDDLEPLQWASTIVVEDIDGDGRDDLAVLAKGQLAIFYQNQNGVLDQPDVFRVADDNSFGLKLIDLNGDGSGELVYVAGGEERTLRVLFQDGARGFGPEIGLPVEVASSSLFRWNIDGTETPGFAYINANTRLLEIFSLRKALESPDTVERLQALSYSLGDTEGSAAQYAFGDFDGDGRADIAAGDGSGARIFVFLQNDGGDFFNSDIYPSFSDISGMSAGRFSDGGNDSLVVTSRKEKIIGITGMSEQGRLTFPSLLPFEGEPVCTAVGDIDANGTDDIVFVEKFKSDYRLTILKARAPDGGWHAKRSPLEMKRAPEGLLLRDFNGDGKLDLLIFMAREAAQIFVQTDDGEFAPAAEDSAVRKGLLADLRFSDVGFGDVDGDAREELLIATTGFARALRLTADGEFEIVDQFNARQSDDQLSGPVMYDWGDDGVLDLLLYDEKKGNLQILSRDPKGVYRYRRSVEIGSIDIVGARIAQSVGGGAERLMILGKDRFWILPLEEQTWKVDVVDSYETDLKDIIYHGFELGEFTGDNRPEVVAIDPKNHLIEILRKGDGDAWVSSVHFTVFDENIHLQGRRSGAYEPREMIVGDFTGDGRDDLALLVHDRVLVYYQRGRSGGTRSSSGGASAKRAE